MLVYSDIHHQDLLSEQAKEIMNCEFKQNEKQPEGIASEEAEKKWDAGVARCMKGGLNDARIGYAWRANRVEAAAIAILSVLPWAWYFLLRRVAELSAAARGNPPGG